MEKGARAQKVVEHVGLLTLRVHQVVWSDPVKFPRIDETPYVPFGRLTQDDIDCDFCSVNKATQWVNVNVMDSTWPAGGYCRVYVYCDTCYAIAEPSILKCRRLVRVTCPH